MTIDAWVKGLIISVVVGLFGVLAAVYLSDLTFAEKSQNSQIVANSKAIEEIHTHDEKVIVVKSGDTVCLDGLIRTEYNSEPFGVLICAEITVKNGTDFEESSAPLDSSSHLAR